MTRTKLIHSLTQNGAEEGEFIAKSLRGNVLWTLWKKGEQHYIVCYHLYKKNGDWLYERQTEDSPPTTYDCPKKYLTLAAVLCKTWREELEGEYAHKRNIKARIRQLFKRKKKGQKLQIIVKARSGYTLDFNGHLLNEAMLYVISVRPGIEGRCPRSGLRYSIPLKLVTDVALMNEERHHAKQHTTTITT
jgi:hypothetical protein